MSVPEVVSYWPWWAGALGLATVAVVHLWWLRRPLGVSGQVSRLLRLRSEREAARTEHSLPEGAALEAALMQATLELAAERGVALPSTPPAPLAAPSPAPRDWLGPPLFLGALVLGGALSAVLAGGRPVGNVDFQALFPAGPASVLALLGGGLLVGFGTRLAGGCTSGHGLSGVARLQPASLLATATFFGTGVAVSFLLERVLR